MSIPSTTLQERMAEARASSEAAMIVRLLSDSVVEPSTKRFVKGRAQRAERWLQLARVASEQANGLAALAKVAVKRPRAPKVVTHEPDGLTPEQLAAAAETHCEANR